MDAAAILQRLDYERRWVSPEGVQTEVLPSVTRARAADGAWHQIVFSSFSPESADDEIVAQVRHYGRLPAAFEWKVYAHDRPADLRQRLAAQGFEIGPVEAVLVLDLSRPPAWLDDGAAGQVVRVQTAADVERFRRTAAAIFAGDVEQTARELAAALARHSTDQLGYISLASGEPVSVGRLYTSAHSHFAGLYGGGTLPAHRGQGHYRRLVAARAQDAVQLGARYLLVDALPTSRPILERLGFVHLTETWPCTWQPEAASACDAMSRQ